MITGIGECKMEGMVVMGRGTKWMGMDFGMEGVVMVMRIKFRMAVDDDENESEVQVW